MRTPALWLLLPGLALGQFAGFSTSHDGRVLHFSTMLRQSGTQQLNYGKIFRVTPEKGVELVLERDFVPIPSGSSLFTATSSYYRFNNTFTGANGELIGYGEQRDCRGPSSGACLPLTNRTLLDGTAIPGTAKFSPSGEFALAALPGGLGTYSFLLFRAGQTVGGAPAIHGLGKYEVGDDGSFAYDAASDGDFTYIVTASGRRLVEPGKPYFQFLGTSIYLLQATGALEAIDLTTGTRRSTHRDLGWGPIRMGLSGTVYQGGDGLRRMSLRGGAAEVLTKDQMLDFVVSRNEGVVWYLSASGEIKSLDLSSGATRTYVRRTPVFLNLPPAISANDLTKLPTTSLGSTRTATPPLPNVLEGVRVFVNGQPAPIASVGPDGVVFQAPPAPAGLVPVRVDVDDLSEFAEPYSTTASVLFHRPRFVLNPGDNRMALAAHADWSGLVTNARPAQAGEVLHFYLTGWSGIPGAPPLGQAAPLDRAITADGSVECWLDQASGRRGPVDVLFLGLAPGTVGYSQLSIRVPAGALPGFAQLNCQLQRALWNGGDAVSFPVQ